MSRELDDLEREFADLEQNAGPGPDRGPERGGLSREGGGGLRTLPITVAVIALLAFGAIIWYAYTQGVRSGSEEAAPLLAPEGEAKVQPSDPGGMEIAHTDQEVFDRISGDEAPAGEVEQILPPPEDPMQPPAPQPTAPVATTPAPAPTAPVDEGPTPPSITAPIEPAAPPPPDETLAAPLTEPPTAAPAPETGGQTAAAPAPEAAPAPAPAPEPAAEPTPEPGPEPAQAAAVDPASDWRVQLAALSSEADARAAWSRLQQAHSAQLGDLSLAVQQAVVGGTTYFRVRGGPLANRAAAESVCTALKAKNQACLIVRPGG